MRRVRVIPVLAIDGNRLIKTVKFKSPNYIGDPVNAIKIFNDKEVDEIAVVDITASKQGKPPNFQLIEEMAAECFMPMAYGGGINSVEQAVQIFKLGVEKVIVNTVLAGCEGLIGKLVEIYGSQSIVASLDIKKSFFGKYYAAFCSGTKSSKLSPWEFAVKLEQLGIGELVIHNIDREGSFQGYDLEILKAITSHVTIPIIALGGAGKLEDFFLAVKTGGVSAVAAASFFIYKKNNPRSILINYPTQMELNEHLYIRI